MGEEKRLTHGNTVTSVNLFTNENNEVKSRLVILYHQQLHLYIKLEI